MEWSQLERRVREIASYLWGCEARAEELCGVQCDCVARYDEKYYYVVEVTKNQTLEKVREDIAKIVSVQNGMLNKDRTYVEGYIVMAEEPTESMRQTGKASYINVCSVAEFECKYFDYKSYVFGRNRRPFGSLSIQEEEGMWTDSFVPVGYCESDTGKMVNIASIAEMLKKGRRIILLGNFGTGKSRCVKQLFTALSEHWAEESVQTFAISLREHWGAKRGKEIVDRHLDDLGINTERFSRVYSNRNNIYLLDGFDEIGTQRWATEAEKMKAMRAASVVAIKDLAATVKGGLLITGREHFFNSDNEMLHAMGLEDQNATIIRCKEEFDDAEAIQYIEKNYEDIQGLSPENIEIPAWLPKRPLMMQLAVQEMPDLFRSDLDVSSECDFWDHFMEKLCKRESAINAVLDHSVIRAILVRLSRLTRIKPLNFGPITMAELSDIFEAVTAQRPNDESLIMLQRLPGIGRLNADSPDRQFIDSFILDGLRAEDIIESVTQGNRDVLEESWKNPINTEGCRILAQNIEKNSAGQNLYLSMAKQASGRKNQTMAGDICAAVLLLEDTDLDFKNILIDDGMISYLCFEGKKVLNFSLSNCCIETIDMTNATFVGGTQFKNCIVETMQGVPSESGLPSQFIDCVVGRFQTIGTTSRINHAKLSEPQKILVAILKKTFFQPGKGRKEEALLRGLGAKSSSKISDKVLNKLLEQKVLRRHKGDEGWVYSPMRDCTERVQKMMAQLTTSKDSIWQYVTGLTD